MLEISEAEAGAGKLVREKIDMAGVIRDACELFQPAAEDKCITLISEIPATCWAYGDIQRIQRMVAQSKVITGSSHLVIQRDMRAFLK